VDDPTVQAKKRAAENWCRHANQHAEKVGSKYWYYLLIPHDQILPNSSIDGLIQRFANVSEKAIEAENSL
jgi:type III restriction enzyme